MAIYLLNCSVDVADENPDHLPEDLSINDQESMIEIFLEIGLGIEDAIPENEDADGDQETSHKKKLKKDIHFYVENIGRAFTDLKASAHNFLRYDTNRLIPVFFKVPSPPPRIS